MMDKQLVKDVIGLTSTTTDKIKTLLNSGTDYVTSARFGKLVGIRPIIQTSEQNSNETVMIEVEIQSKDLPIVNYRFVTKPITPKDAHIYFELQPMEYLNIRLPYSNASLSFFGTNLYKYTVAPRIGFELLFET